MVRISVRQAKSKRGSEAENYAAPSSRICSYTCFSRCSEMTFRKSASFMYLAKISSFYSMRSMNKPSNALTKT